MVRYAVSLVSALIFTFCMLLVGGPGTAEALTSYQQQLVDRKADSIVDTAASLIGKATYNNSVYKDTYPYEFGCGGFVYYVFLQNGIDLHTRNNNHMIELGTYVPKSELKKGDLVLFDSNLNDKAPSTHVAIYYGDNKVIHMADTRLNVVISDLNDPYYKTYYATARRVIPGYMSFGAKTRADEVVEFAERLIGVAKFGYPTNENTLTFTSPAFVRYIYKQFGFDIGMYAKDQVLVGQYVPKEKLQRGDLVFFSTEANPGKVALVGVYAGNLQVVICASQAGANKVLLAYDFYKANYVTARRLDLNNSTSYPNNNQAANICSTAKSLVGKVKYASPYNEGTLTFNSSEFAYYVYKKNGITLGATDAPKLAQLGKTVSKEALQPGDLIFFSVVPGGQVSSYSMVGIYCGNDAFWVNVPSAGVVEKKLSYDYYQPRFVTAKRYL